MFRDNRGAVVGASKPALEGGEGKLGGRVAHGAQLDVAGISSKWRKIS